MPYSKDVAKQNRKSKGKPAGPRPAPDPAKLGLLRFHQGNYPEAISRWSSVDPAKNPAVRTALAEALFRKAVAGRSPAPAALADLRRATELAPEDPRYRYQLGLALHRAGELKPAREAYGRAAELGLEHRGLRLVRGLAELELSPHCSPDTLSMLEEEDRAALEPVAALLRGEARAVLAAAARGPQEGPDRLWEGLAAAAARDPARARTALAAATGLTPAAEAVRLGYLGAAALATGDPEASRTIWSDAVRAGDRSPRWRRYLAVLEVRHLAEGEEQGSWAEAQQKAHAALAQAPEDPHLLRAVLVASHRLAEAALAAGAWDAARRHLVNMLAVLSVHPKLGPTAPLQRRLALACEQEEDWEAAAEAWTMVLRSLPRRSGKRGDAAERLDAQRQWLRNRIVESYRKAGRPDAAIRYFREGVKSDPDNLELRLDMAVALVANEQVAAAQNELGRILQKDPNFVPAYLVTAEIYLLRGEKRAAEYALRHVLKIEPGNEKARNALLLLLRQSGAEAFNNGDYRTAARKYTEALEVDPEDVRTLVFLGETELLLHREPAARRRFEAALATGKPEAYEQLLLVWLNHRHEAEATQLLARAEAAGAASGEALISMGLACLFACRPEPPPDPFERTPRRKRAESLLGRWGRELIDRGLAQVPDRAAALKELVGDLMDRRPALALPYAREFAALHPDSAADQLALAGVEALAGEVQAARDTLHRAERLARRRGDRTLLDEIAKVRRDLSDPMMQLFAPLLAALGPEGIEELLEEGEL